MSYNLEQAEIIITFHPVWHQFYSLGLTIPFGASAVLKGTRQLAIYKNVQPVPTMEPPSPQLPFLLSPGMKQFFICFTDHNDCGSM